MSQFKRGDRVEATWYSDGDVRWIPAVYLGIEPKLGGDHVISFDAYPTNTAKRTWDCIRHPPRKVKRMMQDWIDYSESWTGKNSQVISKEACYDEPPNFPCYTNGGWRKTGAPYEKEFEVPNE